MSKAFRSARSMISKIRSLTASAIFGFHSRNFASNLSTNTSIGSFPTNFEVNFKRLLHFLLKFTSHERNRKGQAQMSTFTEFWFQLLPYQHLPRRRELACSKRVKINSTCNRFTDGISTIPICRTTTRRIDSYRLIT